MKDIWFAHQKEYRFWIDYPSLTDFCVDIGSIEGIARLMRSGELKSMGFKKIPTGMKSHFQRAYVLNLISSYRAGLGTDLDATSLVRQHARSLISALKTASVIMKDRSSRNHLLDLYDRLYEVIYKPLVEAKHNAAK